jgi:ankyrin repeat/IBR domain-containing protein 1
MLCYRYLTGKIEEGEAHNITCPGYQCVMLVPVDMIERLVSRDTARRFLQFDIKVCT